MLNDEKRCVEETYTSAGNSSDLRVEAEVRSDADVLIAAGWSPTRVGMALLRLHSEWDKAEKPRRPAPGAITLLAATMPAGLKEAERVNMARRQAHDWYMDEMAKLVNKLKSLPAVRAQLTAYVPKWGIAEAAFKVPAVIAYWLDQTCPQCHGLKYQTIPGAPTLSNRACKACGGVGVAPIPHGHEGRRVANYMDDCVSRAQSSLKRRLRGFHNAA